MERAKISLCLIARNEAPRLERLLPPLRDHIAEIIVVDTGSADETPQVASKYADKVVLYTKCNNPDTGLIEDFSDARNYSFSLATQPWILWVDADDEVIGAEHLNRLTEEWRAKHGEKPGFYLFPYEYAHDANGKCTLRHYRERLLSPPKAFKFVNEVHEVCVPIDPFNCIQEKRDDVIIRHNRSDKPVYEPSRNLRILKRMLEKHGENDARHLYYIGLEYTNTGDLPNGIKYLEKYVAMSGWDDEKCMALMKLCEIYCNMNEHYKMIDAAHRAIRVKESWGEPYFYLAKAHYFLAQKNDNAYRNWQLCAQYGQMGLMLPLTETILFLNPLDRQVEIHRYMNVALNAIGKTKEAMESVETALQYAPNDPQLLHNKHFYLTYMARDTANKALAQLNGVGGCSKATYDKVIDLLDGKIEDKSAIFPLYFRSPEYPRGVKKEHFPTAIQAPHSQAWAIPSAFEYDDLPLQMTNEQLQSLVLLVWKQYIANNEIISALHFLDKAPYRVRHTFATEQAIKMTKGMILPVAGMNIDLKDKVAISNHIYEQLTDPVNQMMIPVKNAIEPDGKFLMTTTNGANTADIFADPIDGTHWLERKKSAYSAPTAQSLTNQFRQAGYYVENAFPNEDEIKVEAALIAPTGYPKLDIVFWIGDGLEVWTPETVKKTGIGGSEGQAIELSKRLVKLGHRVRMYVGCGSLEGVYDGVEYLLPNKFPGIQCDVLIVSRYANMLSTDYNIQCKMKLLWCHDIIPVNGRNKFLLEAYRILALSEPHRQHMLNEFDIHPDHILQTRNGIDLSRFSRTDIPRNRFKAINSSSPDRSWLYLFDIWPKIKEQVPQAELHLYYGFENWEKLASMRGPVDMANLQRYKERMKEMEPYDVVFHGRVDQKTLAEEMLSAGCWLYPTMFTETSCQLVGTLIFTKKGMKKIEDIQVGDLVLTHKGRFRRVEKLICKEYSGKLYSIKRKKDFNPITLTEEHPLYVASFHRRSDAVGSTRIYNMNNKKIQWMTPNNIQNNLHYLVSPKMDFGNKTHIFISQYVDLPVIDGIISSNHKHPLYKKIPDKVEITEDFAYILGLFAAEGCVSSSRGKTKKHYSAITFALHEKEQHIVDKIEAFFGKCYRYQPKNTHGITITHHNSVWANFLKNIIGTSVNKKIPEFLWDCSANIQQAFINGIVDGDGSKQINDNGSIYKHYTSISPSLAYGVSQLLGNQGHFPSIAYSVKRRAYSLSWDENPMHKSHLTIDEGFASRVESVDYIQYDGLVYNFEVEEDRSYTTDRTIVHNCLTAMEMQAAGVRMITSNIGALKETAGDRAVLIDGDPASQEYQDHFINAAVMAMNMQGNEDRLELQEYAKEHFCLDKLAQEWDAMIYDLLGKVEKFPLPPYQPTTQYK